MPTMPNSWIRFSELWPRRESLDSAIHKRCNHINGGDGDIGGNHNGGPTDSRFSDMANPAAGCYNVGGVDLPCTWSLFDVFEFFVWTPAKNAAASAPSESLATWVPPKRVVPLNIPNPFDKYVDVPVERVDTTYTPGYWNYAPASFVNITIGQRSTTANPQKSKTEDNPNELQSDNNGKDCGVVVTFEPGTSNKPTGLPHGPSTVTYKGGPNFGLGFSVSGWVGDGGIGTIGVDATTGKKLTNPANPKGRWSLEQWTHSWIGDNGKTLVSRSTFPDLPLSAAGLTAEGNIFGYYDHPGGPPASASFARYDNYLIKVYAGKTVCEVAFHMIQTGNNIVWGRGLR